MEYIHQILDFFLHLDQYLGNWIQQYGPWVYVILFLIIFTETGLVIMPLLPGDSLLFAVGAFAATGAINIWFVIPLLIVAALCGDNTNYFVGKYLGAEIKKRKRILFLKHEYIEQTETFYQKHGGKTVIMARFIPIIRTIAPFVAGAGSMTYSRYILFCISGAILWVGSVTLIGYLFGNIPWVKQNFEIVIFGIIGISLLPIIWQVLKRLLIRK